MFIAKPSLKPHSKHHCCPWLNHVTPSGRAPVCRTQQLLAERDLFTTRPTRETPRAGATPELRDVMAKRREARGMRMGIWRFSLIFLNLINETIGYLSNSMFHNPIFKCKLLEVVGKYGDISRYVKHDKCHMDTWICRHIPNPNLKYGMDVEVLPRND